jgi:hypothetical protein
MQCKPPSLFPLPFPNQPIQPKRPVRTQKRKKPREFPRRRLLPSFLSPPSMLRGYIYIKRETTRAREHMSITCQRDQTQPKSERNDVKPNQKQPPARAIDRIVHRRCRRFLGSMFILFVRSFVRSFVLYVCVRVKRAITREHAMS